RGIVQQNVECPVNAQTVLDHLAHLPGMRDIGWHTDDLIALAGERCSCISEFLCLAIGDDEACPSSCERLGDGTPNTLGCASDQRYLANQAEPFQAHDISFSTRAQMTPSAFRRVSSSAGRDGHSSYTSAVCSPSSGAGCTSVGDSDNWTGLPGMVNSPQVG